MTEREIQCVWFEPTDLASVSLRRYADTMDSCEHGRGYHNASVLLPNQVISFPIANGYTGAAPHATKALKLDTSWPTKCEHCDYAFKPEDAWQLKHDRLFKNVESSELVPFPALPLGAMWDGVWYFHDADDPKPKADGHVLYVRTPAGDWCIDAPQSDGTGGWLRMGQVPKITVTPSINFVGLYHGWLTDGVLKEC